MLSVERRDHPRTTRPGRPGGAGAPVRDLRFSRLIAKRDWLRLPRRTRARFSKRLGAGQSVVYRGRVARTAFAPLGRLLAWALIPFGAPLPLEPSAGGEAAVVTVTEDPNGGGQFWTRQYNRRRGFPQIVHSAKAFAGPTGLEERVGGGLGMSLRLDVRDGQLLFVGERYFATLLGRRIGLPALLSPGRLVIGHRDLGAGGFEFTLTLSHPWFGTLIRQSAVFDDPEGYAP